MVKNNTNSTPVGWDKESVYDHEIAPLMTQIIKICKREKIPMLASFAYRHELEGDAETFYCTTHLQGPNGADETLSNACRIIRVNAVSFFSFFAFHFTEK